MNNENIQPKMIFIEGVDRVGKGSLMQAIHKVTKYKHCIFDRGVFSNMVYAIVYKRNTPQLMEGYEQLENQLLKTNHLVIYLTCDTKELNRRVKETNHEPVDFGSHKKLFQTFVNSTKLRTVIVDTTKNTPDEIAIALLQKGLI